MKPKQTSNSVEIKTKQPSKSKFVISKKLFKPVAKKAKLSNCFVKLDRNDVENKIAEMKRTAKATPPARSVKKVVAPASVQKRRASIVATKSANKASPAMVKAAAKESPVSAKSAVSKAKGIIAGRDKALLKHTTPITSKRTPKPNRRYMNDQTVSKIPSIASWESESHQEDDDEEEEEDEEDDDEDVPEEPRKKEVKKEVKSYKKRDTDEDWSEEEELLDSPAARRRQQIAAAKSEPPRKRGRPPKDDGSRKAATVQKTREVVTTSTKVSGLNKRKLDLDTSDAAKRVQIKKKIRQERSPSPTEDSDDSLDEDDARSNLRLRKVNAPSKAVQLRKSIQSARTPTPTPKANNQLAAKRSALSATLKQKLNTSAPGPQIERAGRSSITKSSISANCTPINSPKFYGRKRVSSPTQAQLKKKVDVEPVDLEDFEQMPTFTIVNINDIINQKEDVVVIEKKGRPIAAKRKAAQIDDDDVEYQPSAESMDDEPVDSKDRGTINRRKAQHTAIRSEKMKAGAANSAPPKILNNTVGRPYRNIKQNGRKSPILVPSSKGAPRILNSTLCRNTSMVEPRVLNDTLNNNNVAANNRTKGNVVRTFNSPRAGLSPKLPPATKTVISQQIVQGGTTRRVRKITCFETWFVIKLPIEDLQTHSADLSMSLIKLGNDIGQVPLPSDQWSYNISLLRKANINRKSESNHDEVYTGEVQDISIKPEDRHLYAPTNIMFRRKSQNASLRMQFDRAIIFKNKKFYINIEGKNVKLLAAPAKLECLPDIETLLEIVNDLTLSSPLVEQTSYIA